MPGTPRFADVLHDALQSENVPGDPAPVSAAIAGIQARSQAVWASALFAVRAHDAAGGRTSGAPAPMAARAPLHAAVVGRPARILAAHERRALDELTVLGAALGDNFTELELKRAYRRLALRHHPDRRTNATAADREHAGRTFAHLTTNYRALLALCHD